MVHNRMTKEADLAGSTLNLQDDLARRDESTAILNVVVVIAHRSGIDVRARVPESIGCAGLGMDVQKICATSLQRQLGHPEKRTAQP